MKVLNAVRQKLSALRSLNSTSAEANYRQGKLLANRQDWQGAIECYQQAIADCHPQLSRIYYDLGNALSKLSRFEAAIDAYQQSIAIEPDFDRAYQELAAAALQLSKWDLVVANCHRAIQLNPHMFWNYYYLGHAAIGQQQWDKAIQAFQQAIEIDPHYYWTYQFLSDAYRAQDRHDENVRVWQQGIASNPTVPEFYRELGDALTRQDRVGDAIAVYRTASRLTIAASHPHFEPPTPDCPTLAAPNFIIIGTVKGGTTSLYSYLTQHPQILPAIRKEIGFWSNDAGNFPRGLDWYRAHLPVISPTQTYITGEATPYYLTCPDACERLARVFPHTKSIVLLRNPIDRAISRYYMYVREGLEHRPLEIVLRSELDYLNTHAVTDRSISQISTRCILPGLYLKYLQQWLQWFPPEQLAIFKSEDFFSDPAAILDRTFQFLGVEPDRLSSYPIQNQGYYPAAPESIRQALGDFFKPHNQALETFLGQQFNWD
jgi:cytochrome c-type biogenesis protein CcmH/NrfG